MVRQLIWRFDSRLPLQRVWLDPFHAKSARLPELSQSLSCLFLQPFHLSVWLARAPTQPRAIWKSNLFIFSPFLLQWAIVVAIIGTHLNPLQVAAVCYFEPRIEFWQVCERQTLNQPYLSTDRVSLKVVGVLTRKTHLGTTFWWHKLAVLQRIAHTLSHPSNFWIDLRFVVCPSVQFLLAQSTSLSPKIVDLPQLPIIKMLVISASPLHLRPIASPLKAS